MARGADCTHVAPASQSQTACEIANAPQGPRACHPKALSLRLPRALLDNAVRGHLRSGIQHSPRSHPTHCSQAPRLSQQSHPDNRPRPGGLSGRRGRSQEPACRGHGLPCSLQPPGHPRPRGGSTVRPRCLPSRQNTPRRQGQERHWCQGHSEHSGPGGPPSHRPDQGWTSELMLIRLAGKMSLSGASWWIQQKRPGA